MKFRKAVLLIPYILKDNTPVSPFYDYPGFRAESARWAGLVAAETVWLPVLTHDRDKYTTLFVYEPDTIYLNFCDGTDDDGYPGLAVTQALEKNQCIFTGAGSQFYRISSSKWLTKSHLQEAHVPVAGAVCIQRLEECTADKLAALKFPLICKLNAAAEGLGMQADSVARNFDELLIIIERMFKSEAYPPAVYDGVLIEEYIVGPEYTVLILPEKNQSYRACPAVEIKYVPEVPELERNLFQNYKKFPVKSGDTLVERAYYANAEQHMQQHLQQVSLAAFHACKGISYGRVDLRYDGKVARVLEVNANCSFSQDEPNIVFTANQLQKSIDEMFVSICDHAGKRYHEFQS